MILRWSLLTETLPNLIINQRLVQTLKEKLQMRTKTLWTLSLKLKIRTRAKMTNLIRLNRLRSMIRIDILIIFKGISRLTTSILDLIISKFQHQELKKTIVWEIAQKLWFSLKKVWRIKLKTIRASSSQMNQWKSGISTTILSTSKMVISKWRNAIQFLAKTNQFHIFHILIAVNKNWHQVVMREMLKWVLDEGVKWVILVEIWEDHSAQPVCAQVLTKVCNKRIRPNWIKQKLTWIVSMAYIPNWKSIFNKMTLREKILQFSRNDHHSLKIITCLWKLQIIMQPCKKRKIVNLFLNNKIQYIHKHIELIKWDNHIVD